MFVLNIVKEHDSGIVVSDKVEVKCRADGIEFMAQVNANPMLDWKIIDFSWDILGLDTEPEILVNPTGGRLGKLL
jgi:hypothetical protein